MIQYRLAPLSIFLTAFAPALPPAARAELRVPAFTAYCDPNPRGASISEKAGVTNWKDAKLKIEWFGEIKTPGNLECALVLRLPVAAVSKLRLTVDGEAHEATATGKGADAVTVSFGEFTIAKVGYQRFTLESLNDKNGPNGDLETLVLDGPAAKDAHFNLKERRNAASVHLNYPLPKDEKSKDEKIEAFYCEVTGVEDPPATYYEACGWHRGYLGMQVNSPTERRIIFSVWDSGGEGVDRAKVGDADRVSLVAKGEGVSSGDFGHEGTGGHSHLVFPWKTGEKQRFIVTAKPTDATHTIYSGYYFRPNPKDPGKKDRDDSVGNALCGVPSVRKEWMLISSWKAPKDGAWLHELYSFSEDFDGGNGHLRRKALYGNQWLRTAEGKWLEQTTATFSHDLTGKADRLDRFMGVEDGQFFLSQGGFVDGFTKYGEKFTRPATHTPPSDLQLPPVGEK